jgi:SsrA-binding protein
VPKSDGAGTKLIAQNRRARHDYDLEDRFEAGIQLVGTEVKSCRESKVSLADAYATVRDGEAWLLQAHIAPYSHGNRGNHDPLRPRKLLLHRGELQQLEHAITREGKTLVPLRLYFKQGLAKAEIAIAKGRKSHDKRHAIAQKSDERRMRQAEGRRR